MQLPPYTIISSPELIICFRTKSVLDLAHCLFFKLNRTEPWCSAFIVVVWCRSTSMAVSSWLSVCHYNFALKIASYSATKIPISWDLAFQPFLISQWQQSQNFCPFAIIVPCMKPSIIFSIQTCRWPTPWHISQAPWPSRSCSRSRFWYFLGMHISLNSGDKCDFV